jgi:hypothetical protein
VPANVEKSQKHLTAKYAENLREVRKEDQNRALLIKTELAIALRQCENSLLLDIEDL